MNILVIGGGGREHAVIKKLKCSPEVQTIYALPGNGGIAKDATCVAIGAKDIPAIVEFAKTHDIDFAVVTPDDPLVLGCVDALEEIGIKCFGPRKNAAIIEGSKVFSKNLMKKYGIPTAAYEVFDDLKKALAYLETAPIPTVLKADGLAFSASPAVRSSSKNFWKAPRFPYWRLRTAKQSSRWFLPWTIREHMTETKVSTRAVWARSRPTHSIPMQLPRSVWTRFLFPRSTR